MASLDANENAPIPKRACKSAQNQSKPVQSQPKATAEPVAKINRENFFSGITLKPNGLFDLPDLNEHFDKQFDEVSAQNTCSFSFCISVHQLALKEDFILDFQLLGDEAFENLGTEYEDLIREAEKKAENRIEINLEAERKRNEEIKNINCQNPLDEMR